jgi:hypothetical protein
MLFTLAQLAVFTPLALALPTVLPQSTSTSAFITGEPLSNATFLTAPRPSPAQIAAALTRINGTPSDEDSARARRDLGLTQTEILFDLQDSYHVEVEWQFSDVTSVGGDCGEGSCTSDSPEFNLWINLYTGYDQSQTGAYSTSPELYSLLILR